MINAIYVTIVFGFFVLYIFCKYFLGAINFNVYQFTTDTVYMYIYQKCNFGLIAVKCIIFQVMLNFIIYASTKCRYLFTGYLIQEFKITCTSIHVYTYYKIQWVPFNLIAAKQIFRIYST